VSEAVINFIVQHPAFDPVESNALDAVSILLRQQMWALARRIPIPDFNGQNRNGRTLLTESLSPPRYAICEYILSLPGIDVNRRDRNGVTPLGACLQAKAPSPNDGVDSETARKAFAERKNCVRFLLAQSEIDVNLVHEDSLETTLMVLARAQKPDTKLLETAVQAPGIDVHAQNADGETAAMVAAAHGHKWLVERLASVPGFDTNLNHVRKNTAARLWP
jgi:ankyrin repeat protein